MITEGTNSPEWFVLSLSFVVAVLTQGQFSPQGALAVSGDVFWLSQPREQVLAATDG